AAVHPLAGVGGTGPRVGIAGWHDVEVAVEDHGRVARSRAGRDCGLSGYSSRQSSASTSWSANHPWTNRARSASFPGGFSDSMRTRAATSEAASSRSTDVIEGKVFGRGRSASRGLHRPVGPVDCEEASRVPIALRGSRSGHRGRSGDHTRRTSWRHFKRHGPIPDVPRSSVQTNV
ncbi:MAG: hypothetical protein ACI91T_002496, partial [Natronomonas sp.]